MSPKSRQELEAELACLKSRLREYETRQEVDRETGEAFLQTLSSVEFCQSRLKATSSVLCDAQHELQLALRRYTDLFNNSPIGYFLLDDASLVKEANYRGAELLSGTPDLLHGRPFIAFLEPEERPLFERHLAQVFQGQSARLELTLKSPLLGGVPIILQTSLMEGDDRHEPMCLAAALDIHSRVEAEKALAERTLELARSNEELERFAYVVSHDLQEPLRNIGNYAQLLSRRYKGKLDDDAEVFIGFITDGVSRLTGMIRDLLAFSRITTAGKKPERVDSGAALKDALVNLETAIQESGAEIETGPMPPVKADRVQLVSLFQNLIGNALKYQSAERRPLIRVKAKAVGEKRVFSVADNGVGIESRQFERLFSLFQRHDPTGNVPGTGIGLAICKRIVERHGGEIWVESTLGQGSVFYFTLESDP